MELKPDETVPHMIDVLRDTLRTSRDTLRIASSHSSPIISIMITGEWAHNQSKWHQGQIVSISIYEPKIVHFYIQW